ncbi:hypothetical protein J6590_077220 [Homalodisca vitripennis]|nr:hypothetical protein J6590_077220 [Homalodisca vitripennis]
MAGLDTRLTGAFGRECRQKCVNNHLPLFTKLTKEIESTVESAVQNALSNEQIEVKLYRGVWVSLMRGWDRG